MDRSVHKQPLQITDHPQSVGGKVVHVGCDPRGVPCVWFDTGQYHTVIRMFGTGHQVPQHANYVGSVVDGSFVWHVFEV